MMKVYIIRHGKTPSNAERRYSGCRTNDPLSDEGRKELVRADLGNDHARLFTSPLRRAVETAEIMFPELSGSVVPDLREIDFGLFDGKNHSELDGDAYYQKWIDSYCTIKAPDGEDMAGFVKRTMAAFRDLIRKVSSVSPQPDVYIVAHGGTVMAVMSELTGKSYFDFLVPNGAGYQIDLEVDDAGNIIAASSYDSFRGGIRSGSADR